MKRSDINALQREAEAFIRSRGFYLPPFAYWTSETWRKQSVGFSELVEARLVGRFPEIEEDPAPFHLLVSD